MEFSEIKLIVAEVTAVETHPNADKLYVLKIKADNEKQLVAGLKQYYSEKELTGKKLVIVGNLKPAKLRGIESEGMLLAAENDGKVKILEPDAPAGTIVTLEGEQPNPKEQISIEEFFSISLIVKEGKAMFDGKILMADGKPVICELESGKVR